MISQNKAPVGIIGFGRFGKLLAQLLGDEFPIYVYDTNPMAVADWSNQYSDIEKTYSLTPVFTYAAIATCPTIILAVPIRTFSHVVTAIAPYIPAHATVIDVCSVKIYPVQIMLNQFATDINVIATHPLFGPDSIDMPNRKIMMYQARGDNDIYEYWKHYFSTRHLQIIEMTPEQHDELAARSQNITHFIGRILEDANLQTTNINTPGFNALLKLKQQTCHDSWELFYDLQQYNPYSQHYIQEFINSTHHVYQKILSHIKKDESP